MAEKKLIPLQILTGFLGSGKTSLLNEVVGSPDMKGTVLIINEVGEVGIDDKLISKDHPAILLQNGCICCSLQDGLVNVLHYLIEVRDNGELEVNRVIIETTGIADPAPIINLLFNYIDIEYNYAFAGTITILDGVNGKTELAKNYESVKQIALADKIIISKCDRITPEEIESLRVTAHDLNPDALIFESSPGKAPMDAFVAFEIFNTPKDLGTIMKWVNSRRKDYKLAAGMTPVKQSGVTTKALPTHSSYETVAVEYDRPLNRISVMNTFSMLCRQFGEAVLRLKGIFDFGEGYPFVIHGVQGECYPVSNMASWEGKEPFSVIVLIVSPRIAADCEEMLKHYITYMEPEQE
ncbi:CobW family GTP-binding protein [Succinimonas sp.]|uniref:CobW family GTP-binding protein n=1 Tax=Succinimonas sp. TaxID=1936151 RepID=UPI00386475C2